MRRSHNVFHESNLTRYNTRENPHECTSAVIAPDGTTEQVVKAILDKKKRKRKVYYLVQFDKQSTSEAIWMHKSELKNCSDLAKEFEMSHKRSNP